MGWLMLGILGLDQLRRERGDPARRAASSRNDAVNPPTRGGEETGSGLLHFRHSDRRRSDPKDKGRPTLWLASAAWDGQLFLAASDSPRQVAARYWSIRSTRLRLPNHLRTKAPGLRLGPYSGGIRRPARGRTNDLSLTCQPWSSRVGGEISWDKRGQLKNRSPSSGLVQRRKSARNPMFTGVGR